MSTVIEEQAAEPRPIRKKAKKPRKVSPVNQRQELAGNKQNAQRGTASRPLPSTTSTSFPSSVAHQASPPAQELGGGSNVDPQAAQTSVALMPAERQAVVIERAMLPSLMASALGLDSCFTASGYRAFLDKMREDAGNPTDPVEIMLLEQLVMAHCRAAQLQAQAGTAEGLEAVKLYNSAAARLLGEFRLTALALKAYREPGTGRDRGGTTPVSAQPTGK